MINTRLAILLFLVMWIISAFIANIAQQIDFDIYQTAQSKLDTVSEKSKYGNLSVLDDSADQLMWFIQISDLHLSIFRDPDRINDLHDFGCRTLDVVRPAAVVASGDLTDAKHRDNMGSGQYEKEWEAYNHTLSKCRVREKTIWLDIRGNHDNFDVPGWKSKLNYFRTYSVQGSKQSPSYMHIIEKGGQKFAFLALDACLDLGPRRPFNFIGMLTRDNVKVVQDLLRAAKDRAVDHIIWFGHYPTSCIVSLSDDPVRKLIGDEESSKVYLCGHLHTMGGLITKMYTLQRPGYLELELGDWKDNRIFRVAAFDHGLFNFVDIRHGAWPIILITNPKNAMYALPKREPLHQMQTSTHIRLLAFSVSPIVSVQVKIDDGNWRECSHVEGPLYAVPWSPTDYLEGVHTIYARVKDNMDRVGVVDQPFSIDATKVNFNLLAKLVLMLDASTIFQCFFGLMLVISTLPLITLRLIHNRVIAGKMRKPRFKKNFFSDCVRKLWVLSTVDQLFYPLVVYDIYLCFGPWAVGELMEGYLGAVFAWGLLVNGVFIPGSFTYIYGFMQLFLCQFPLTLFLANQADKKLQQHHMGKRLNVSKITLFLENIPFIMIWALNMHFAYFFGLAYGWLAFFLGPLRTWSIVLNAYLWYKSTVLPPHCTCEAAAIWTEH